MSWMIYNVNPNVWVRYHGRTKNHNLVVQNLNKSVQERKKLSNIKKKIKNAVERKTHREKNKQI